MGGIEFGSNPGWTVTGPSPTVDSDAHDVDSNEMSCAVCEHPTRETCVYQNHVGHRTLGSAAVVNRRVHDISEVCRRSVVAVLTGFVIVTFLATVAIEPRCTIDANYHTAIFYTFAGECSGKHSVCAVCRSLMQPRSRCPRDIIVDFPRGRDGVQPMHRIRNSVYPARISVTLIQPFYTDLKLNFELYNPKCPTYCMCLGHTMTVAVLCVFV